MEEANAGDAGGSGSNTGPGVLEGDATQCKDRNGRGSGADGVKPVEGLVEITASEYEKAIMVKSKGKKARAA